MPDPVGEAIRARRQSKAWTIEDLAAASGVAARQNQRIEAGESQPKPDTLAKISAALNTDASQLLLGLSRERLDELIEANACPFCRAPLVDRVSVPLEHGKVDFDRFECGATRGWRDRPCSGDPAFPTFEQYEIVVLEEFDGTWSCLAVGRTEAAKSVDLDSGHGRTPDIAKGKVRRAFVQARDGYDAEEAQFPFDSLL